MKNFDTNKILETKIRIYQSNFIEELKDYFERHNFRNKNEFYLYLLREGLTASQKLDEDAEYYYKHSLDLHERITNMENTIKDFSKAYHSLERDYFTKMSENQALLLRLYSAFFRTHEDINREYYDLGIYDFIPAEMKIKRHEIEDYFKKKHGVGKMQEVDLFQDENEEKDEDID